HRPPSCSRKHLRRGIQSAKELVTSDCRLELKLVMPLLKLETTVVSAEEKRRTLLASLSKLTAETIGKAEEYVMVTMSSATMLMSGKTGDAAFVEVRSVGGLSPDVTRTLAQKICALLVDSLGIPKNRIYLNFAEIEGINWGWNGGTF